MLIGFILNAILHISLIGAITCGTLYVFLQLWENIKKACEYCDNNNKQNF